MELTITTERLILRMWREDDMEPYASLLADPNAARFIVPGGEPVTSPLAAWQHTAVMAGHWALHGIGMFVVTDRHSGSFFGRTGVWSPPGWFGKEVAWALTAEERGKGIAFEAAAAVMDRVFRHSSADELIHCIDDDNAPSQRLAKRLGARQSDKISLFGKPAHIWRSDRRSFENRR